MVSLITSAATASLPKLSNYSIDVYTSMQDVDYRLKVLERCLTRARLLIQLKDTGEKKRRDWEIYLNDLEEFVYDADDLFDEMSIRVSNLDKSTPTYKDQVCKYFSSLYDQISSSRSMHDIHNKIDAILKELDSIQLQDLGMDGIEKSLSIVDTIQTSSLFYPSHVFNLECQKAEVIRMLPPSQVDFLSGISLVSIVGMVGVGKTTLAQVIYMEMEHFWLKMWVCVATDFNVKKVTKSILEAATGRPADCLDLDLLQSKLRCVVAGKPFLLVLDDLWLENKQEWDLLLRPLLHGSKKSRIIITTRSHTIASMVTTSGIYHLKCMSDRDCWDMIKQNPLRGINLDEHLSFDILGQAIAKKCKGLPLVAMSIGSLLKSNIDLHHWKFILMSDFWGFSHIQNQIHSTLRSSYNRLPAPLKQCIAYCSIFPQGYMFSRVKLAQLWIGGGFVQGDGQRTIRDCGFDYFDHLVSIYFILRKDDGFIMHEAVHDFSKKIAGAKYFCMEDIENANPVLITRHLSLTCTNTLVFDKLYSCKGLRTILSLQDQSLLKEIPSNLYDKLARLRVLDFSHTQIKELDNRIDRLIHLRFLDLSSTLVESLPESLCELLSLITLKLNGCLNLCFLPESIGKLRNLKDLEVEECIQLKLMPRGIGLLVGLQTLSDFIVGQGSGQIEDLKNLNLLEGSICIKQLEEVRDPLEAGRAELCKKIFIDKLTLEWTAPIRECHDYQILENLVPCRNVKELTLKKYNGQSFPTWMSDPLFSKLSRISLHECIGFQSFPPLGQLQKLKHLIISNLNGLENFDAGCGNIPAVFQSLERLELRDMANLNSWCNLRDSDMKCLHELSIVDCPLLTSIPSLHCLEFLKKLTLEECPQLESFSDGILAPTVRSLLITGCPILTGRCMEGGIDWMKIEHIDEKVIDD